jgi:hypothetical protein
LAIKAFYTRVGISESGEKFCLIHCIHNIYLSLF